MSSEIPYRAPVKFFTHMRKSLCLVRCSISGVAGARILRFVTMTSSTWLTENN